MTVYSTIYVGTILIEKCVDLWWRRFDPNEGHRELDERGSYRFGRKPRWEEVNGKRELVFEMTSTELTELIRQLTGHCPEEKC